MDEDVRREWNACSDVVDVKYGGFGFTRSAEPYTRPWIETRDCMVQKGYYHTTPHLDGTATRYPPATNGPLADVDSMP